MAEKLEEMFEAEVQDALSETDIEDPKAAKRWAAEEAYSRLADRLSDLLTIYVDRL